MPMVPQDASSPKPAAGFEADAGLPGLNPAPAPPRKAGGAKLWLRDLLVSAVASLLIITFLYQPVRVEGTSMLPRLEDQRPPLHQQVRLSLHGHRARRRGGLSLSRATRRRATSSASSPCPATGCASTTAQSGSTASRSAEPYVPEEYRDSRSYAGDSVIPSEQLLHDGRPSFHLLRQPRVWPRRALLHLRQGRLSSIGRHSDAGVVR